MDAFSRWKPCGNGIAPPIPEFLSRVNPATAGRRQPTPAASPEEGLLFMSKPTDNVVSIAKPAEKSRLDKFKSKKAAALANIETLPTELKIHSIAEAKDFVRFHSDEENWSSSELCFVNVPIKGQKKDTLHLIDEDIGLQYLHPGRILRNRLVLATKPFDVHFLCKVPSRNLDNEWNRVAIKACEMAKTLWVIVVSRKEEGVETYKVDYAQNQDAFSDPKWPEKQTLDDLILARFEGLIIDRADHPGLLRLIGAKQVNT
jgi:hypothetical protein